MQALVLALGLAMAPADVESDPSPSAADRAGELFMEGRFVEAAAAFEAAYEASENPAFLFGRAQALRRAGNCEAAISVLKQFIEAAPPAADADEAREVIEICREVLGDEGVEPGPPPERVEPIARPVPITDPMPADRRAWPRDVLGGVLLGGGVLFAIGGASTYGASFALARDRDETEAAHEARVRTTRRTAITGIAAMGIGGGLLVASVVRYVVVARRSGVRTSMGLPLLIRF